MDNQNKYGISPLAAGLTGLILGVAGTITLAMADEKTRERTAKKADELRKSLLQWSDDTVNTVQKKSYEVRKDLASRLDPDTQTADTSDVKEETTRAHLHN